MRAAAYLFMVVLVVVGVALGQMWIALSVGGAKAIVVGLEFMELRHAARPHRVGFVLGVLALTALLVALT